MDIEREQNIKAATNLEEIEEPFATISGLPSNSIFYVNVDIARDGKDRRAVRDQIIIRYKLHYKSQVNGGGLFKKILFCGHRSSGKTTELLRIADALSDYYYIVFLNDLDKQNDRLKTEIDFLYYIVSLIIEKIYSDTSFCQAIQEDVNDLYNLFEEKIFSSELYSSETNHTFSKSLGLGLKGDLKLKSGLPILSAVLKAFSNINAKENYETETRNLVEKQMRHYSQEFKDIANRILIHVNDYVRTSQKKLLLVIADGLDKLLEDDAKRLFHGRDDIFSQLNSNFIITFPVFLQYSSSYRSILQGYDEKYALSMIMVRNKNGTIYETGREAIEKIVEKRMDVRLFDNKELLWEIIDKSGGNLRDLFRLIRKAAINAIMDDKEKIDKETVEDAYTDLKKEFIFMLNEDNISLLNKVFLQTEKKPLVPKDENDDTLMKLLNSDMIIEYNDVNGIWCDLHPLVADIFSDNTILSNT